MGTSAATRPASRAELGLERAAYATLRALDTPQKIQVFVSAIPINHELGGETLLSVSEVLAQRRAHCIEAAFVAACAMWIRGRPPLVMHLDCTQSDDPHVIALFRERGAWGAISKSNGMHLRHRDAVYRSLRELAMSYFHEYFDRDGRKTMRSYSSAFDMRRLDPTLWVNSTRPCEQANARLAALRHYAAITTGQVRRLAPRDAFERDAGRVAQYPRPRTPRARMS